MDIELFGTRHVAFWKACAIHKLTNVKPIANTKYLTVKAWPRHGRGIRNGHIARWGQTHWCTEKVETDDFWFWKA